MPNIVSHRQFPAVRRQSSNFSNLAQLSNLELLQGIKTYIARSHNLGRGTKRANTVDQRLQKLMQDLGEAINESLSDSEQIAEVIAKIKTGGYDVFLVLEATIGFNRRDDDAEPLLAVQDNGHDPELKVSPQDVKFLKSLRIVLEGEEDDVS